MRAWALQRRPWHLREGRPEGISGGVLARAHAVTWSRALPWYPAIPAFLDESDRGSAEPLHFGGIGLSAAPHRAPDRRHPRSQRHVPPKRNVRSALLCASFMLREPHKHGACSWLTRSAPVRDSARHRGHALPGGGAPCASSFSGQCTRPFSQTLLPRRTIRRPWSGRLSGSCPSIRIVRSTGRA